MRLPRRSNGPWLAVAALLFAATRLPAAEPAAASPPAMVADSAAAVNVFADAVAFAQARCVKIYGAGIGREHGYATGLIVSANGKILCAQGIYLAGDRIRVVLPDGSMHLADVVRRSDAVQAALLKIDASTPNYFDVPETPPAKKGDWLLAVSNLFNVAEGAEQLSVNLGIASLRTRMEARRGASDVHYDSELLLIDAITSNPGAPGGAVITVDGRLAGMVGKIVEGNSTNTRLNYAVPADLLRKFLDDKPLSAVDATTTANVSTGAGSLGIQLFTLGGKRAPAYIDRVNPDSPAEKAGLRKDDLVIAVGGDVVRSVADYQKTVAELKAGVQVTLILKRGQEIVRVSLTTAADPTAVPEKTAPNTSLPSGTGPAEKPAVDKPIDSGANDAQK